MAADLARILEAFLVFALVVLTPGYVVAWLLNLLDFRQRLWLTRLTLAVPVSIGICPIITYLAWRFVAPAVWVFYGACAIGFAVLLWLERRNWREGWRRGAVFFAILAGWVVLVELTLCDLQIGHRLYFPTVTYDYSLRTTVTASIARAGIPPLNPFFYPGRFFTMHYHYFWLILCAVTERMA